MRTYKTHAGPFSERPFYKSEDIEQLCIEELRNVGLLPTETSPIRIERFVEKRFKIIPVYENLQDGVLGFIEFGQEGVKGIVISKALAEEETVTAERRINTTLAHESGHGLLHTHLFVLGQKPDSLFGKEVDVNKPKILCRNNSIQGINISKGPSYNGCWWEYQANLAIGPLLLPRFLVMTAIEPFLVKSGLMEIKILNRKLQDEAVKALVDTFNVNPIVAKIRLEALFPEGKDSQLTL